LLHSNQPTLPTSQLDRKEQWREMGRKKAGFQRKLKAMELSFPSCLWLWVTWDLTQDVKEMWD
jgi:hypothetical protein